MTETERECCLRVGEVLTRQQHGDFLAMSSRGYAQALPIVRAVVQQLRELTPAAYGEVLRAMDLDVHPAVGMQRFWRNMLDHICPPIAHEVVNVVTKVEPLPKNRAAK